MKRVKQKMIEQLRQMVEDCNMATLDNDLPSHAAFETFKHLRDALVSLDGRENWDNWVATGEWPKE